MRKEPDYYKSGGLSPLEAFKKGLLTREEVIGFCKGNIIKYTIRAGKKGDCKEDIQKAKDYLNELKRILNKTDKDKNRVHDDYLTNYPPLDIAAPESLNQLPLDNRPVINPIPVRDFIDFDNTKKNHDDLVDAVNLSLGSWYKSKKE